LSGNDGVKTLYLKVKSTFALQSEPITKIILLDTKNACADEVLPPDETDPIPTPIDPESPLGPNELLLQTGDLFKGLSDTVHYFGLDGKRHIFPDVKTFYSWFNSFASIIDVADSVLSLFSLGETVTHRPGTLITFSTDEVYLVTRGSIIRHLRDEAVAVLFFGEQWNEQVKDVDDTLFTNYFVGEDINRLSDISLAELGLIKTIDESQNFVGEPKTVRGLKPLENMPPRTQTNDENCFITSPFTSYLAQESRSAEVLQLQELLQCLNYFPADITPNGVFGDATEKAVKAFQAAKGITALGVVGPSTRKTLNTYLSFE
jgi:hypothetical protein